MGLDMRHQLRVNPIACTGHGMCAELLPEIIELDPWGYPILAAPDVPRHLLEHARRAVDACPTLALLMDEVSSKHR
jgi:ferredoxin